MEELAKLIKTLQEENDYLRNELKKKNRMLVTERKEYINEIKELKSEIKDYEKKFKVFRDLVRICYKQIKAQPIYKEIKEWFDL